MESLTIKCSEESVAQSTMRRLFEQRGAPLDVSVPAVLFGALFCQVRRPAIVSDGEKPGADGMVGVRPGETLRVALVLPRAAMAAAYLSKARWLIGGSNVAMKLLQRSSDTTMTIRRPDGLDVSIEAMTLEESGHNLRSTWLVGALFDDGLLLDDDGPTKIDAALRAAWSRLLPGAIWAVVSHK
jgi:hypothetical protein